MWRLAPRQLSEIKQSTDQQIRRIDRGGTVVQVECGGCISASTSLSLSIEGVCSELVQTRCFRFSRGGVARVSTGHLSLIRLTYRPIKTRLLVPWTQTQHRRERGRKREGVLAHTWRIKRTDRAEASARGQLLTWKLTKEN